MLALQSTLLAAHLLFMNLAAVGPLGCVLIQWCVDDEQTQHRVGRRLANWSLMGFVAGTVLGLGGGIILWAAREDRFFSALGRLPAKVHFGLWELAFYVMCMLVYTAWWKWFPPRSIAARVGHGIVGLAAATNLLWHFPALMTVVAHLAATEPTGDAIGASGFRELMFHPEIASRWLHIWLASFATTGVVVSWLAQRRREHNDDSRAAPNPLVAWGGRAALAATLLQLPVGVWVLLTSREVEQSRLMGGDPLTCAMFLAGIAAAIALMHQLAAIAMGNATARNVNWSTGLLSLTVLLMCMTLHLARG